MPKNEAESGKKRGRKPRAGGPTQPYPIRLTDDERQDLEQRAHQVGLPPSALGRRLIAGHGQGPRRGIGPKRPGQQKGRRVVITSGPPPTGGCPAVWGFGYTDFAALFGMNVAAIRKAVQRGSFNPASLASIFAYLERIRSNAPQLAPVPAADPALPPGYVSRSRGTEFSDW